MDYFRTGEPYVTTGASCNGVSGAQNRVLTITGAMYKSRKNKYMVYVDGTVLFNGVGKDFTIGDHTITFLNALDDIANIVVVPE